MTINAQRRFLFAAVALGLAGVMRVVDAVWALSHHDALPLGVRGVVVTPDLSTIGWVYMAGAAVSFLCGSGVIAGSQFSRWVGIGAGSSACMSTIWPMPHFPAWPVAYIVLGGFVLCVLVSYEREPASS